MRYMSELQHNPCLDKRNTLYVLGGVGLYSHSYAALWQAHQHQQRLQKRKISKHIPLPQLLAHLRKELDEDK